MALIGLKFCGGCNPQIDRLGLLEEIKKRLPPGCHLTLDQETGPWEAALLICGCPTACADDPKLEALSRCWIRISGAMVERETTPENKIAEAVMRKLFS
ncbi:MAG: hypothetical protein AB1585_17185 [Thermodesulfobacteriota bacterium]